MIIFSLKWYSQGHGSPALLWEGDAPACRLSREAGSSVERVLGVALRHELQCPGPQFLLSIHKMLRGFHGPVLPQGSSWQTAARQLESSQACSPSLWKQLFLPPNLFFAWILQLRGTSDCCSGLSGKKTRIMTDMADLGVFIFVRMSTMQITSLKRGKAKSRQSKACLERKLARGWDDTRPGTGAFTQASYKCLEAQINLCQPLLKDTRFIGGKVGEKR